MRTAFPLLLGAEVTADGRFVVKNFHIGARPQEP